MNKNQEELNKDYYSLIEKKYVLMEDSNFFADVFYFFIYFYLYILIVFLCS